MNLLSLIHAKKWSKIPERITSFPSELKIFHDGNLPIHTACRNTNIPVHIIRCLIEDYPESLKIRTLSFGQLPLHCAVCARHTNENKNIIQVLLENYREGASVESHYGHLPLYDYLLTCYEPLFDVVQMLVEAYPDAVHINDNICAKKFYPLHCASIRSNCKIVQYLINIYPDALIKLSGDGRTAKDIAHNYNNEEVEKLLHMEKVKRFGFGNNCMDNDEPVCFVTENTEQRSDVQQNENDLGKNNKNILTLKEKMKL